VRARAVWAVGPDKWRRRIVGFNEVIDVLPELFDRFKGLPLRDWPCRIENQISTWLSQEARVGVKWKLTLG
jgi:hypothetical protein